MEQKIKYKFVFAILFIFAIAFTSNAFAQTIVPSGVSAESISDTLREGETRQYIIDGKDYEVTLVYVTDPGQEPAFVKFSVNGELTTSIFLGESSSLTCSKISVNSILVNSREGVASFTLRHDEDCGALPAPTYFNKSVSDTLREGETRVYVLGGVTFETVLVYVTDPNGGIPESKFGINGELTTAVPEGRGVTMTDGTTIQVHDIVATSREGIVSFTLTAGKGTTPQNAPPRLNAPGIIVVGESAPTSDVIDSIDLAQAIQSSETKEIVNPIAMGAAILDVHAYASAIYYQDDFADNLIIVIASRKALVIKGSTLTDEQQIMYERSMVHLKESGFEVIEKPASVRLHPYLVREQMLTLFDQKEVNDRLLTDSNECESILTPGLNPQTQQCFVFETPCEVPSGWIKVSSCGDENRVLDPGYGSGEVELNKESCTSGCIVDDICAPIGTRLANGESRYCGLGGMQLQKADEDSCQNNYECKSNQCYNAICVSLEKDIKETRGLMQSIVDWFGKIFG